MVDRAAEGAVGEPFELDVERGKIACFLSVAVPQTFHVVETDAQDHVLRLDPISASPIRINGGFFVLEPSVLDLIPGDDTLWEREPMEALAAGGELHAYRHEGFWQPMDTLREKQMLQSLWESGKAPWCIW